MLENVVETEAAGLAGALGEAFRDIGSLKLWLWPGEESAGELLEVGVLLGFKILATNCGSKPKVSSDLASNPCKSLGSRPNNLGSGVAALAEEAEGDGEEEEDD